MQIGIDRDRLDNPELARSAAIVRNCVHCGFCLATCPTYQLTGNELDSPRGRIYQIKEMLENGGSPAAATVTHVDRCLSCLACVSTCPSDVDYMHLVDHARAIIEKEYRRPWAERLQRTLLTTVLTHENLLRSLLWLAPLGRLISPLLPARLRAVLKLAPARPPRRREAEAAGTHRAGPSAARRVALLRGCAQPVLAPQINAAMIRHFNRCGFDVVVAPDAGCCGALPHHLGDTARSHELARANIEAWLNALDEGGLDAIVMTASGCGTTVKDYGVMFADEPEWSEKAARVSAMTRDVCEFLRDAQPPQATETRPNLRVAYQSACSLQHGQGIGDAPVRLLREAGFDVVLPKEPHLCCGSAGAYNILQPEIAGRLRERKLAALRATGATLIASGNVGCLTYLAQDGGLPVVHTVELLDWAYGGPVPRALEARAGSGG